MTSSEWVNEVLLRWDDLQEQGQSISPEELCRDRPDLVEEVRRQIQVLEAMYRIPNGVQTSEVSGSLGSLGGETLPQVAGYEMLGVLGCGGMGMVYKALHLRLKRLVALKMILGGMHAGPNELTRLRTEAEAIARLHHPNIVQIYEVGEHAGLPFLALEFVDGGSLAQEIGSGRWAAAGPDLPVRAAQLVETLARAMHTAHEHGIIHRDLKPANILLERTTSPKITDFGLAKRLDAQVGLTQTGAVLGTPSYMAPEQAEGKVHAIGPQTDVYALGAILYELLTGRPPFEGATLLETLEQVRGREPQAPISLQPKLPRDLNTICLKCLEKEPRRRYGSALELAEDLKRYLRGELIEARPFTLIDRVARTLSREQDVVRFHALGKRFLWLTPVPFLIHLLAFLLIRNGWPHVTALWLTASMLVPVVTVMLWSGLAQRLFPSVSSMRDFWSLRIGHWAGVLLLPFVCYLSATTDRPWEPLATYPLWALISGVATFSMGSSFWGRLYLIGIVLFVAAFVMTIHLEWAVLEFGVLLSSVLAIIAWHLYRISTERRGETRARTDQKITA